MRTNDPKTGWRPEDFDHICGEVGQAFAPQLAGPEVTITRTSERELVINGVGRWQLVVRQKRSGNVNAEITPASPPLSEEDLASLRRFAEAAPLVPALQSMGRTAERKLARLIASEALV